MRRTRQHLMLSTIIWSNIRRARQHVLTTCQEKYTNLLTAAVDISAQGLHCVDAELLSATDIYDAHKYVAAPSGKLAA